MRGRKGLGRFLLGVFIDAARQRIKRFRDIGVFVLALYAAAFFMAKLQDTGHDLRDADELGPLMESAAVSVPPELLDNANQRGSVTLVANRQVVDEEELQGYVARRWAGQQSFILYWNLRQPHDVTATAYGLDRRHHFVNSYLVGYQPFAAESLWVPLYTVARRKRYQLDSLQYGVEELWQNSAQAYLNTRGDCEDHALILADWLIASGIDARVVIGTYNGGGHAWVVAFRNGEAFLLEATDKRRHRSWNSYPRAVLSSGYLPYAMFNREQFWINTGSRYTRDYAGGHWQAVSHFSKNVSRR